MAEKGSAAPSGQRALRVLLLSLVLLVFAFAWLVGAAYRAPAPGKELRFDEVYTLAGRNQLKSVRLLDEDAVIVGKMCLAPRRQPTSATTVAGAPAQDAAPSEGSAPRPGVAAVPRPARCTDLTEDFHAAYPRSDVSTQQLIEAVRTFTGADIVVEKQTTKAVAKLIVTFVFPLLMLANLFGIIFVSRGGESSLSDIAGFGRIGRKRQRKKQADVGVTFADVAGADEAVTELREVIDYLTDPARFQAYGAAPPKGVLLFGPPGCGKTLLARATAGETGVPFFSASGTDFVESLVGVGAARVRDLFRQVREVAPAIVFIDEIDAVGRRRSGEGSSGGEREQTLNQLLVELDGFEVTAGIVLMGATNRPDILDPALLRPGRFDRHITLEAPDVAGRQAILELHADKRPMAPDADFELLARRTPGFTGADLANVVNEAALLTIREGNQSQISSRHLSEAVLRVLHGPQRRGQLLSAEERRRIAYHEAGHAMVAAALGRASEVHRVSIVARGRGLAQTAVSGDNEHALLTCRDMRATLTMAMSGVAAEVLAFGDSSTAALDDISRATEVAREMVGLYGMSGRVGPVRLLSQDVSFLGDGGTLLNQVSAATMLDFDQEVRQLVITAQATATEVLSSQRDHLEEMVGQLVEHETLEAQTLELLLSAVKPATMARDGVNGDGAPPDPPRRGGAPSTRAGRATRE